MQDLFIQLKQLKSHRLKKNIYIRNTKKRPQLTNHTFSFRGHVLPFMPKHESNSYI